MLWEILIASKQEECGEQIGYCESNSEPIVGEHASIWFRDEEGTEQADNGMIKEVLQRIQ